MMMEEQLGNAIGECIQAGLSKDEILEMVEVLLEQEKK